MSATINLKIDTNFAQASADLKAFGTLTQTESEKIRKFAESFKTEQVDKFIDKQNRNAAAIKATRGPVDALQAEYRNYQREIERLIRSGLDPEDKALKPLIDKYKKLEKEIVDVNAAQKKSEKSHRFAITSFTDLAAAGFVAINALRTVGRVLSDLEGSYAVQEKSVKLLNAALRANGEYSAATSRDMQEYASELQKITTVGDEATIKLQQVALSSGLNSEQSKKAAKDAIGLSKAFGIDLNAAIKATTNAQQGNYDMLNRYIPAVKNAKDATDKQAAAEKALANAFEVAKAEATTSLGVQQQLNNTWGDTKELLGAIVSEGFTPFRRGLNDALTSINEAIQKNRDLKEAMEFWKGESQTQDELQTAYRATVGKLEEQRAVLAKLREERDAGQRTRGNTGGWLRAREKEIEQTEKQLQSLEAMVSWLEEEQKLKQAALTTQERIAASEAAAKAERTKWSDERMRQQVALLQSFEQIEEQEKLFGESFDDRAAKETAVRKTLQEMINFGFTAEGDGIKRILSLYGEYLSDKDKDIEKTESLRLTGENYIGDALIPMTDAEKEMWREYGEGAAAAREETEETTELISKSFIATFDEIVSAADRMFSALSELATANKENLIAELETARDAELAMIDERLQAELTAAGVAEETEKESLNRRLQEAFAAEDAETVKKLQDEIKRLEITEKYEAEKAAVEKKTARDIAEAEYSAALASWGIQLTKAIANGALATTKAIAESPLTFGMPWSAVNAATAGAEIVAISSAKPKAPTFQTGTFPSGYVVPESRSSRGDSQYIRTNPGEKHFVAPRGETSFQPIHVIVQLSDSVIFEKVQEGLDSNQIVINADNLMRGSA